MDLAFKIKNFLEKLQNLPDNKKKVVLWTIVAIIGLTMGYFWIRGAMDNLSKIGQNMGKINFPSIDTTSLDALQNTTPNDTAIIQPPSDKTNDWKTRTEDKSGVYINDIYNYQINYSSGATIAENLNDNPKSCVYLSFGDAAIAIKTPDNLDLCLRSSASADAKNINQKVSVGGIEYEAMGIIDEGRKYLQFSLPGEKAIIAYEVSAGDLQREILINQMLSTFKFTK